MPVKTILSALLTVIIAVSPLAAAQNGKIIIKGLKIYTEERLTSELSLQRHRDGSLTIEDAVSLIEKFYRDRHYPLVKVYTAGRTENGDPILFVDEGRIGKIIVHGLNNYYSLKFRQKVNLPERVYNSELFELNLEVLRGRFPGYIITADLIKPPDFNGNIIQLDRELQRLNLGGMLNLEFLNRYTPLQDLHYYAVKDRSSGVSDEKITGFGFNIDYRPPSVFVPQISYYDENVLYAKDYIESEFWLGINPGLGGFVKFPPENTLKFPPEVTFIQLTGEYKVSPLQNSFFGPVFRGRFYHSRSVREDLALDSYRYLNSNFTLAPEFTILKHFNIYAGFGLEEILIYKSEIDYTASRYISNPDGTHRLPFTELRMKFDPIPIRIGNRINKYVMLTYTDYYSEISANRLVIQGAYDAEFENLSILSLRAGAMMLFDNPPFYLSENVSNQTFKGFTGKGYFARRKVSASAEYRFSLYQDYLYGGGFFDYVKFEPDGYILSGTKRGVNFGPTARILIYDQFEFTAYLGFDRLYPDRLNGRNLQMRLTKKW